MKDLNLEIKVDDTLQKHGKHIQEIRDPKTGRIIRRKVTEYNAEASMTEQQFAKESDPNHIIKKYGYQNLPQPQGLYADTTEVPDLSTALDVVSKAQASFDALPSNLRERFGNSPELLLKFLADPKNKDEGISLGLLASPQKDPEPQKVFIVNQQEPAKAAT